MSAAALGTPTDSMAVAHSTLDTSVSPSMPSADSAGKMDFFGLAKEKAKEKHIIKCLTAKHPPTEDNELFNLGGFLCRAVTNDSNRELL